MEKLLPQLRFPEFIGEWEEKKLGQIILKLDSGVSVNSTDEPIKENGEFGILKTSSISGGKFYSNQNKTIIQEDIVRAKLNPAKDAIIISRMNTPQLVGESGYIENDYPNLFVPDRLWMTTIDKNNNNAKMLSIILSSEKTMGKISNIATGTSGSMKNISKPNFLNLVIAMPKLPEQTKIATFLTAVDEKLTALKQKKTLLEQYKKGVMQQIFSQELRFKDDTSTSLSTGSGNDFADWEEKKLGELGDIVTGKTPSTTNLDLWDGEIQFVTPTDINDSKYQYTSVRTVKKTDKLKVLPPKSIMFTCIASIGKMSISLNPSITNQQINSIIAFEQYDNEFIYYSLLNITDYIKSTPSSSTLPLINKTEFSKFTIQLPCLKEQTKIANFLSSIDEKINHCQAQIEKAAIWKKGLLQQLFVR
jgi:type I restriction enzyme S subunit